jgi:hypothetical protein
MQYRILLQGEAVSPTSTRGIPMSLRNILHCNNSEVPAVAPGMLRLPGSNTMERMDPSYILSGQGMNDCASPAVTIRSGHVVTFPATLTYEGNVVVESGSTLISQMGRSSR